MRSSTPSAENAHEDVVLDRLLAGEVPVREAEAYGSAADQVYELSGPTDAPVVVIVHGGYFRPTIDRTHARPLAERLADAGYRVVLAEYRRIPGRPEVSVGDLEVLDAHLRRQGLAPAAWVGHSAGGALVLLHGLAMAKDDAPAPLILALAPVSDLARAHSEHLGDGAVTAWLGGAPAEVPDAYRQFDPARLLRAGRRTPGRLVVLHGAEDATVPAQHSRDLPVTTTILAGAHHFDVVDPESPHLAHVLAELPPVSN